MTRRYVYHLTFLNILPSIAKDGLILGYGGRWPGVIWFVADDRYYAPMDPCRDFQLRFPFPEDAELKYEVDFKETGDKLQKEYISRTPVSPNIIDVKIHNDWLPLSDDLTLQEIELLMDECGHKGDADY